MRVGAPNKGCQNYVVAAAIGMGESVEVGVPTLPSQEYNVGGGRACRMADPIRRDDFGVGQAMSEVC